MADERDEVLARLATDVGRIAGAVEALVHRLAVRDGAPRVVCERPPGGADPLAPVNLATGSAALFVNLRLVGDEPATVGPISVIAGDARADGVLQVGSARPARAQIPPGEYFVAEVPVTSELRGPLTAHPQQPLEVRVRFSPGPHAGGTVAVIPLTPAGTMASRSGWLPRDAYDVPEAAWRESRD